MKQVLGWLIILGLIDEAMSELTGVLSFRKALGF